MRRRILKIYLLIFKFNFSAISREIVIQSGYLLDSESPNSDHLKRTFKIELFYRFLSMG